MSLQLFPLNSPNLLVLPHSLLRLSVFLLDSYHQGCHVSSNLLMPNQEKIDYGEREHGIGWSGNREMGRGDEGEDEGTSRQLARPRLSVRTQMCRADVNTHMVQATSTPTSSQCSQSDLSSVSSGLLAQLCWIDTSKERVQKEGRGNEGKLSGKSCLGLNLKTLKSPDGPSCPAGKTGQEAMIFHFFHLFVSKGKSEISQPSKSPW